MAIPAEHLYDSCTCNGGMRGSERCADCGGRGVVVKGAPITGASIPAEEDGAEDDGLEQLSVSDLRRRAAELGLSAGGTKAVLVARIRELNDDAEEDGAEDDGQEADEVDAQGS